MAAADNLGGIGNRRLAELFGEMQQRLDRKMLDALSQGAKELKQFPSNSQVWLALP